MTIKAVADRASERLQTRIVSTYRAKSKVYESSPAVIQYYVLGS